MLQSRCTDETAYVQPTLAALVKVRGLNSKFHNNAIQTWKVAADGSVHNARARKVLAVIGVGTFVAAVTAPPTRAQLPTYRLGRTPTTEEIRAWDITIPPDGKGLPPGSGTATQGAVDLHRPGAPRATASKARTPSTPNKFLIGGRGTLNTDKPVKTIGSYWPYATTLWSYVNRAQPFDEPGSLTADQVYAVTAYLLVPERNHRRVRRP